MANLGDFHTTLIIFTTMTVLAVTFALVLRLMFSKQLATFRRIYPKEYMDHIHESWARVETLLTISADLEEAAAWFTSQPRSPEDLKNAIEFVLQSACQGLVLADTYTRGRFLCWDPAQGKLIPYADYHASGVPPFKGSRFAPSEGTPGKAFVTGEVIVVDDFSKAYPELSNVWERPYKSVICVPVSTTPIPEMKVGVLNFDAPTSDYFKPEHVVFLRGVSNLVHIMYRHVELTGS